MRSFSLQMPVSYVKGNSNSGLSINAGHGYSFPLTENAKLLIPARHGCGLSMKTESVSTLTSVNFPCAISYFRMSEIFFSAYSYCLLISVSKYEVSSQTMIILRQIRKRDFTASVKKLIVSRLK